MAIVDSERYSNEYLDCESEDKDYERFRDSQDIPVHKGLYVPDANELETGTWERTGQRGAFINLYGMQRQDDIQLHELDPEGETNELRHFYDEIVYVLQGNGFTSIAGQYEFEWQEGSAFHIPVNASYKHINASDDEPAKLLAHTSLPQMTNLVKDRDAIFDNDYDPFGSSSVDEFYSGEGEAKSFYMYDDKYDNSPLAWDSNFIPDILKLEEIENAGYAPLGALKALMFPFSRSGFYGHLGQLSSHTYKCAHRHTPGANILIVAGEGYSLMWKPGMDDKIKIPWKPGTIFTPPARWWHQHFNVTSGPNIQFVVHGPRFGSLSNTTLFDAHHPSNIIGYSEEDSEVRQHFEEELTERGLQSEMPEAAYTDPEFEFYPAES